MNEQLLGLEMLPLLDLVRKTNDYYVAVCLYSDGTHVGRRYPSFNNGFGGIPPPPVCYGKDRILGRVQWGGRGSSVEGALETCLGVLTPDLPTHPM